MSLSLFASIQSGVVCDAMGRLGLDGFMDGVLPLRPKVRIAGPARTLMYRPRRGVGRPDLNIYALIAQCGPGEVLVLGSDRTDCWLFGENVAHAAMYRGLAGIVTDSRVRDGAELAELEMPCFARGVATRPPGGIELVAFDVPVSCGGAQVRPQDVIVGDTDGIVVVPAEKVNEVAVQAADLDELEREQERAIAERRPLPELMQVLARKKKLKS